MEQYHWLTVQLMSDAYLRLNMWANAVITLMSSVKWTVDWKEGWGNLPPEYVEKLMCLCYVKLSQLTEQYNCVNGSVELVEMCLCNGIDWHSLFHYLHFAFIVTVYICLSVCLVICLWYKDYIHLQCTYDIHKRCFLTDVCSSFSISWLLLFTSYILVVSNRLDVFN